MIRFFLFLFLTPIVLPGCATALTTTPASLALPSATFAPSMKGWELYSWKTNDEWYFELVVGTNRQKTSDEILKSETRVLGVKSIQEQLARLPRGEQVFWGARGDSEFAFPPPAMVAEIQQYCAERDIALALIPSG